jgi:hypothetical protein
MAMMSIIIGIIITQRNLLSTMLRRKALSILLFTSIGMLLTLYYPERAISYLAPAIAVICAYLIRTSSSYTLNKSLWTVLSAFACILAITLFQIRYSSTWGYSFHIFAAIYVLVCLTSAFKRFSKGAVIFILLIVVYINPESYGKIVPFVSWARPAVLTTMNLPIEAWEACEWLKEFDENAIVASNDTHIGPIATYLGLKTSEAVVPEFTMDGKWLHNKNGTYFVARWNQNPPESSYFLWRKGLITIQHNSVFVYRRASSYGYGYGWINAPPSADAGLYQAVNEGAVVVLDGSGSSDPDDGIAFYEWTQTDGSVVDLSDPAAIKPTFIAPNVQQGGESLTFELKVTDLGGLTDTGRVVVYIRDRGPLPFIRISPTTLHFTNSGPTQTEALQQTVRISQQSDNKGLVYEDGRTKLTSESKAVQCDITSLTLQISRINGFDLFEFSGDEYELHADRIGDPLLPSRLVHIIVPPGSGLTDMQVTILEQEILPGPYNIYPRQPEAPVSVPVEQDLVPIRSELANSDYPFPNAPVEFVETATVRGNSMFVFRVWPLQWIPKDGSIIVNERFEWNFTTGPSYRPILQYKSRARPMEQLIKRMVINPEQLEDMSELSLQSEIFPLGAECYYLIITNSELANAFQALADHKIARGLEAAVLTTDYIYSHYEGIDNQEKIKNCILDYATNQGAIWVLLGGDDTVVPDRNCYAAVQTLSGLYQDNTIPTDLYYGGLDDLDWNDDSDDRWCEVEDSIDLYPDVFVGRAPVRSTTEADSFVEKTIRYVTNPPTSHFAERALLCGVKMWRTWGGRSDAHWRSENMWENCMAPYWGGTRYRLYDTDTDFGGAGHQVSAPHLKEHIDAGYGIVFVDIHHVLQHEHV